MIATSHLIIGGTVGALTATVTTNPLIALALGVVSHLLCDSLPHWDHPNGPKIGKELVWTKTLWIFAFTDSIFGWLVIGSIWGVYYDFNLLSPLIWGAFGGYLPDFVDNVPFWKDKIRSFTPFKKFHRFHEWIHENWQDKYPMPKYWVLGTMTQVVLVVPALIYLLSK